MAAIEVDLDNRNGVMWKIGQLVSEAQIKTARIGKAGSLELSFLRPSATGFTVEPGNVVRLSYDGQVVFFGYVFSVTSGSDQEIKLTAYDQLRYLVANDTLVIQGMTATDVIRRQATKMDLTVGSLADTGYRIPKLAEDNKRMMDMICDALDETTRATGSTFVLFDAAGELTLKSLADMELPLLIGDGSLVYEYSQTRSIDNDTYNQIVLAQDNKTTGKRDLYVLKDSGNIAKWGLLQLYEVVDERLNAAQINQSLTNLIVLKNRESRTFRVSAIGDIRVRAGSSLHISIADVGKPLTYLVDECTHTISGGEHTMDLSLKVYGT
ncbi:XkdQ/YqbQ family protein [Gorillibacterium sp. sgz500922]|uniref:XkdQ/YqbQ family protein n=1 Tax=Gorillibacterium sp. sgz500922 TaxID=3446694 RepID=UPI003F66A071